MIFHTTTFWAWDSPLYTTAIDPISREFPSALDVHHTDDWWMP